MNVSMTVSETIEGLQDVRELLETADLDSKVAVCDSALLWLKLIEVKNLPGKLPRNISDN